MSKKYKITKLDRRHNGFLYFTHVVDYRRGSITSFLQWRDQEETFLSDRTWCWEMFGPSCALGMFSNSTLSQSWAWDTDTKKLKLYLNQESLTFFTLAKTD